MSANIQTARDGAVLTITFDRPEKKNALTNAMYGAFADALQLAEDDPGVRCVLITGAGGMFTSGNDINDFAAVASGKLDHAERHVHTLLRRLAAFPKPIVAAVPGVAIGIGTTMLLHSDVVLLAPGVHLSTPFVDLALVPEAASSLLLQARIGYARAFAMLALGETLDARSAVALGLATRVVADEELQDAGISAAKLIAAKPPGAVVATKRLMRDSQAIAARMEAEGREFEARLQTAEAREAFQAFAERRKPDWSKF